MGAPEHFDERHSALAQGNALCTRWRLAPFTGLAGKSESGRGCRLFITTPNLWNYLADPEKYHASLKTNLPYYSTTLSTAEMRSPAISRAADRPSRPGMY